MMMMMMMILWWSHILEKSQRSRLFLVLWLWKEPFCMAVKGPVKNCKRLLVAVLREHRDSPSWQWCTLQYWCNTVLKSSTVTEIESPFLTTVSNCSRFSGKFSARANWALIADDVNSLRLVPSAGYKVSQFQESTFILSWPIHKASVRNCSAIMELNWFVSSDRRVERWISRCAMANATIVIRMTF